MARLFDITAGQDHEIKLALQNAGVELEDYLWIKNDPELATKVAAILRAIQPVYPSRDYSRYNPYLLSLESQLELLWELNCKLPVGLKAPGTWWLDTDPTSDHVQSVEDLEIFFIVLDTLANTLAANWELIKLTQSRHWHSGFATDARSLQLGPSGTLPPLALMETSAKGVFICINKRESAGCPFQDCPHFLYLYSNMVFMGENIFAFVILNLIQNPVYKSSAKSRHFGLSFSIRSSFQARRHCLSCFSRAMADSIELVCSKCTSFVTS